MFCFVLSFSLPSPFKTTNPTTPTMPQTLPTETEGREELDAHQETSSPPKRLGESGLTSALDSDSDSVLDSTTHFCCRGRERNVTPSRSYRSFRLKFYTNRRCCVSAKLSRPGPVHLFKYLTFVVLVGLYK